MNHIIIDVCRESEDNNTEAESAFQTTAYDGHTFATTSTNTDITSIKTDIQLENKSQSQREGESEEKEFNANQFEGECESRALILGTVG